MSSSESLNHSKNMSSLCIIDVSQWAGGITMGWQLDLIPWKRHNCRMYFTCHGAIFFTLEAKTPRKWSQRLSTHLFVRGKLTTSVVLVDLAALIRSVWRVKTYGFVQGEYFKHGALGKYDCKLCFFFFFGVFWEFFNDKSKGIFRAVPGFIARKKRQSSTIFFPGRSQSIGILRCWGFGVHGVSTEVWQRAQDLWRFPRTLGLRNHPISRGIPVYPIMNQSWGFVFIGIAHYLVLNWSMDDRDSTDSVLIVCIRKN